MRDKSYANPGSDAVCIFKLSYLCFWLCWVFVASGLSSSWASGCCPPIAARGLLIVVAPLVAEHRLQGTRASAAVACGLRSCGSRALEHRFNSCGVWAESHCGTWDLPGPGIEPASPASAGGFFTTEPPGKSSSLFSILIFAHGGLLCTRFRVNCYLDLECSPEWHPR